MSDLLVRGVSDDVVAALDARAARLGLSRNQYLRRRLTQDVSTSTQTVTVDDLKMFEKTFADLGNDEVMRGAWK